MKASAAQDMDPGDLDNLLFRFGIKRHRYEDGQFGWTIDVVLSDAAAQTHSAQLDEHQGKWIIQRTSKEETSKEDTSDLRLACKDSSDIPTPLLSDFDWTDAFPASDFSKVFLDFNWATTPIGPLHEWPRSLQLYTQMLLSDVRPAAIYWGPEKIAIYNEASLPLIGAMHPSLMGGSFEKAMPTLWNYFEPLFDTLESSERGFARHGVELPTARNGYVEESWWDGGLVPLKDCRGRHGGSHFSWTETTRTTLRDRGTKLINRLGLSSLTSPSAFWQHIQDVFQDYPRDIPLAMIYTTDESDRSTERLQLQHTIGLGAAHKAAPFELNVSLIS